ncbi:pyridoxamine 5'-phosphate oxidase family protein [Streptomyces sp. NPDC000151]|uniref:pyridoxamine 5'-phosphate oxidase family protein n=1 Tax=Streptomyces sp. NPDC000151 TaxID=3154244 RepID=UPI00331767FE
MSTEDSSRWGHSGEPAGPYPDEYAVQYPGRYASEYPDVYTYERPSPAAPTHERPGPASQTYEPSGPETHAHERSGRTPRVPEQSAVRPVPSWAVDEPAERPGSDGEHLVQQRMGTTDRADRFYRDQVLDHLNARMREFVGRQEMFFLATADGSGECDSTFRAGPPGFVRVLDERTLIYPEYRGNGVLASLGNLSENPRLGILFVDFLRDRIGLHVNGRAWVVPDEEMRVRHPDLPVDPVPGRRAQLWVAVEVEEAYIHCAKHIPHLQKAPRQERGDRAWGTDDVKRKGGDFFGAAADAADRAPYRRREETPETPAEPAPTGPRTRYPSSFQEEAERVLALVQQRAPADSGDFRGWFG